MKILIICSLILFMAALSCSEDSSFFCIDDQELLMSECPASDLAFNLCSPFICTLNDPAPGQGGDFIVPRFDEGCEMVDCETLICQDALFEGITITESEFGRAILTGDNFECRSRLAIN